MKILLLSDYFYPFTPGGSEWSVYELAKALGKNGVDTQVVSINYGTNNHDAYKGIKILRIPFFKKIKDSRSVVNPIWQNNPIFFIVSAYFLIRIIRRENPDVVHCHGKFLIVGAVIAGFITNKPVVVTIRDKQILCPIGKCFFDPKRFEACSFWEYLTVDFPWFAKNYTNHSLFSVSYAFLGTIWSRISGEIIKYFAKRASAVSTISHSQKKYLEFSGFKNVEVIYNTADFKNPQISPPKTKSVLFVGKLSKGKGVEILLDAAEKIIEKFKVEFIFAGSIQSARIKKRLNQKPLKSYVKLLGSVNYDDLPKVYRSSSVLVMPSIYPESFDRSALESLSFATPAVVANTGALPEIVEDKITGRVCEPTRESLEGAILDVLQNEEEYRKNIAKNYHNLKEKFMINPIKDYLKLYKLVVK